MTPRQHTINAFRFLLERSAHGRMDYGRESIVREDWKKVFNDDELDKVISRMLKIESSDTLTHSA